MRELTEILQAGPLPLPIPMPDPILLILALGVAELMADMVEEGMSMLMLISMILVFGV